MTNFRPTPLSPEALKVWDEAESIIQESVERIRELTAPLRHPYPQPEPEKRSSDGGYEAGSMWAGHPMRTHPPVAGEVAELVEWLRGECAAEKADGNWVRMSVDRVLDVADLLQRQHPQPVPVSERLPGPEDCDEQGRCWWATELEPICWTLRRVTYLNGWIIYPYFLPHYALPTPEVLND